MDYDGFMRVDGGGCGEVMGGLSYWPVPSTRLDRIARPGQSRLNLRNVKNNNILYNILIKWLKKKIETHKLIYYKRVCQISHQTNYV